MQVDMNEISWTISMIEVHLIWEEDLWTGLIYACSHNIKYTWEGLIHLYLKG